MNALSSAAQMDRQYRFQRHVYDATRTRYLLWRRRLIADLHPPRGGSVVEVACGTGWNLLRTARSYPTARLYGFDISRAMLTTAASATKRGGFADRIILAEGDATTFDLAAMFELPAADRIFISYALSMIPDWPAVIDRAVAQLAPGGSVHIVDFGRMEKMPALARTPFRKFLSHYNVTPRLELESVLRDVAARNTLRLTFEEMPSGYSAYAVLKHG